MSEQTLNTLFFVVFLGQVILASLYLPRQVLARVRRVLEAYPPASHPKLYGAPLEKAERAQRVYRYLNLLVLAAGLAFVLYGILFLRDVPMRSMDVVRSDFASYEFLLAVYLMAQFAPLFIAVALGFPYFSLQRKLDTRTTRTALLKPRRLVDFVSSTLLGAAVFVYVAFIVFVAYVRQFDFPWFGGYLNVVMVTAANLFFLVLSVHQVRGKRKDPYQDPDDRTRQLELTLTSFLLVSIALTVYIALHVTLKVFELDSFAPIGVSLYFQLLAVMTFRQFRIDHVNFDVYREEPVTA